MAESYIYVLSTGRAGTNFIHRVMIELYPNFKITHQTRWSRLFNIVGNLSLAGCLPAAFIKRKFLFFKNQQIPGSTFDPLLSIPIGLFLKSTPNFTHYKVIHLVRDPRDFVSSFINWKNQNIKRRFLHHFVPFWQPNPVFCDKISFFQRIKMSKFEYFSWVWNFKNHFFENLFAGGDNYFLVRMEDLSDPERGDHYFKMLFDFLGLSEVKKDLSAIFNRKINKSTREKFPRWRQWENKQAEILYKYCGQLMKKYGYGGEKEWEKMVSTK